MSRYLVEERKGMYRVIDGNTNKPAVHASTGNAIDGGGHTDNRKADRQAGHLNDWDAKQGE
jgi:hypothetical protein